jgi:hypothetical protein
MSVSRMSDTASKVAGLETCFEQMETQFTSSFARLEAIISGLGSQCLATNNSSTGSKQTPVQSVNLPASASAGGSSTGAAGQGS